ncbi:MAG: phage tail tape measure protein, partial [Huintestinicola sp.]
MEDGTLIFNTEVDTGGIADGIRKAQNETNNLSAAASSALGNMAANAARDIANAVQESFKTAAQYVVSTGSQFEASMSQVSATMGITTVSEDYARLAEAAKKSGAETKYSATEAGNALNYLALAGYSAEQSVSALPTVLNVAAAGNIDLAYASDMITDSMSALGLGMDELNGFADKLATTSQKSNTSVGQLGEAILTVGGTAKTLSGGVGELNTMLGLIADNGIKGAEGGTALRNIILSLSAPTDKAAAALEELNVKAFDNQGNLRDLSDVFGELDKALAPLSEQKKTEILNEIFNKVDLKAVNALLGTSSERFDELRGYIENCDGAAGKMAETMSDNLSGDLQVLNSSLEAVGVSAYEKFTSPMRSAVQDVSGILGELNTALNGELGTKLERVGDKLGDLAVRAAEFAVDEGLPKLIDGLEWICDHDDQLVTAAETAAAMVIAYKGLTAAGKAATAISGVTTALAGATTAQQALNIAMTACPWAAVATLAIGGAVALRGYIETQRELIGYEGEVKEAYNDTNEELARKIGLLDELSKKDTKAAYEEAKNGLDESTSQYEKNIVTIRDLKRALQNIDGDMEHQLYTD